MVARRMEKIVVSKPSSQYSKKKHKKKAEWGNGGSASTTPSEGEVKADQGAIEARTEELEELKEMKMELVELRELMTCWISEERRRREDSEEPAKTRKWVQLADPPSASEAEGEVRRRADEDWGGRARSSSAPRGASALRAARAPFVSSSSRRDEEWRRQESWRREAPRHREDEDIEALIERHADFPNPPICLGVGLGLGDDHGVGLGLGSQCRKSGQPRWAARPQSSLRDVDSLQQGGQRSPTH